MQQSKHKPIFQQIIFILIAIVVVGMVCIGAYAYMLMNNPDYITLGVGESYTLTPREAEFIVRSYDANIITPTNGSTVTATTVGDAVVGVRYTYFDRDFYRFKVIDAPNLVTISKSELHLGAGETYKLSAQCDSNGHKFAVSYSSSDETIATVAQDGTVTANKAGQCTLTAQSYNGVTATCTLTVSNAVEKLSLNTSAITLGTTESFAIEPEFKENEYSHAVEYTSSNDDVAKADDGVITATGVGKCTVTVTTHNSKTAKCSVTVKKLPDKFSLLVLDKYNVGTDIKILTDIGGDYYANDITVSVSDDKVLGLDSENPMLLHCKQKGKATITLTLKNGVTAEKTVTVGNYTKRTIDFDILNQHPSLPTGCEVVSLTSVLNHYSLDVSMTTMADKYMPKKEYDYYCVSPHDYFLGTPYTWKGFGCFSGCIVKTAHNYFEDKKIEDYIAIDITGCSVEDLQNYLQNDVPVITWVTSGFVTPTKDGSWYVGDELITWCNHEHCLVTTGYDKGAGTYTVGDDTGGYSYTVSASQFEKVFKGMGSMAVVVLKK